VESGAQARALALAWRALATRERTVAELRAVLARRGVEPEAAEVVVRELEEAGHLDDLSFAHRFVEDRRVVAGWGTERIARALERRGVGADLIAAALAPVGEADELEAALLLLARRFADAALSERDRASAWRLLVRRGYGSDCAYEAVRKHVRSQDSAGLPSVAAPRPAE
jgi:regulatory protein